MLSRFHLSSRAALVGTVIVVVVVGLATTAASARVRQSGKAPAPRSGGTLVIALNAGWDNFDPASTAFTFARQIMNFIYEPLLTRDPETKKIVPDLAESWTISADKKTVTLKLRHGVTFQDGTPFNAAAVVFSFNRIIAPTTNSPYASAITGPIRRIRALNSYTVRLVLKAPFAPLLDSLTQINLAPVSPAAVKKWGKDFGAHPVGAGPFQFESQTPNDNVVLTRYAQYKWGAAFHFHTGPAYLDKVVIRNVPEDATRMALAQSGQVDVVYAPIVSQLQSFANNPSFRVSAAPRSGVPRSLILNTSRAPFNDPKVRQAVAYAINKKQILQVALGGIGSVASNIITPSLFGYSRVVAKSTPSYNPEKAKQLLQSAGWTMGSDGIFQKGGEKLTISYGSSPTGAVPAQDAVIQANLKAVGISANIENQQQAAFLQSIRAGKWDASTFLFAASDPDVMYTVLFSGSIDQAWNTARYNNKSMDSLLVKAREEFDPVKRAALYETAEKLALTDLPYVPLYNISNPFILNSKVRGFRHDTQGFYDIYDAWVST